MDGRIAGIARLWLVCGVAVATAYARHGEPVIKTDGGFVQGTHSVDYPTVVFFLGIPYAAPPVGTLRWRPPQPPTPWNGVRKANELSAACPQSDGMVQFMRRAIGQVEGDPSRVKPYNTNEDCLYLNVMTASARTGERRPVMVYIHGGSGISGRGDDGGAALGAAGAVVVTLNYRLGVLGWLAHPALTAESAQQSSGNYGLLDQIAALQWVHRNIAQFGGDPENVTIFGHSSGGEYGGCLMISPPAHGLFQRAILQSSVPFNLHPRVHHPGGDLQSAEEAGLKLVHALGVGDGREALKQLRSIPADRLVAETLPYDIVVDGWLIPDEPLAMFAHRQQEDIPVMVGSTEREYSIYAVTYPDRSSEAFHDWVERRYAPIADDILRLYPAISPADATECFIRAGTELIMTAPARWLAEATLKKKSKAYVYNVTWAVGTKGGQELGAFHGIDIALLFRMPGVPWDKSAETMAQIMRRYWIRFARTGNPNGSGLPNWPAYGLPAASYLELGTQTKRATALHDDAFRLIKRLYAARLAALAP